MATQQTIAMSRGEDAAAPGRRRSAARSSCAAAMALLLLSSAAARADEDDPSHITVRGTASAPLLPDVAVLRLGIAAEDADAAVALKAAVAAAAAVTEAAAAEGIAAADVAPGTTTLQRAVAEAPPGGSDRPRPYRAAVQLRVRLRDPAKVGTVLAALVAKGATRVEGVDYGVADPAALMAKLTGLAVADARHRAEAAAAAAGARLGPLLSIEPPDEPAGGSRLDRVPGGTAGTASTTVEASYEIER